MRLLRHLAAGLLLGIGLGAVARGFMALLTEAPQFSWEGTLFIVGVFAVAGLALSAAHAAKLRGRSRWWKLLAVPAVVTFLGQGMLLLPVVAGTAMVASRRTWVRVLGGLLLSGFAVLASLLLSQSDEPVTRRTVLGLALLVLVAVVLADGAKLALAGWVPSRSADVVPAQPEGDRRDRTEGRGDGSPAEDPLDLDDRRVEERLRVGLVGQ